MDTEVNRCWKLTPHQHMKANSLANLLVLILFVAAVSMKHWFTYKSSEFSLRAINMKELGGWREFGDFEKMCTEDNVHKYSDLKDDCNELKNFELAGVLYLVFCVFGMLLNLYNTLTAASVGWSVELGPFIFDFPHMLAPVTYAFAMIFYIVVLDVAFLKDFTMGPALWLAVLVTSVTFVVAFHYQVFKTYLDGKNPYLHFIQ